MSDNDGLVYLINTTSDASAGWYDPGVARALLTTSTNWETADPPGETAGEPGKRRAPDAPEVPPAS